MHAIAAIVRTPPATSCPTAKRTPARMAKTNAHMRVGGLICTERSFAPCLLAGGATQALSVRPVDAGDADTVPDISGLLRRDPRGQAAAEPNVAASRPGRRQLDRCADLRPTSEAIARLRSPGPAQGFGRIASHGCGGETVGGRAHGFRRGHESRGGLPHALQVARVVPASSRFLRPASSVTLRPGSRRNSSA